MVGGDSGQTDAQYVTEDARRQSHKRKGLAEANPLIFIAFTCCRIYKLLRILVGRGGLEPPTNGLKVRCSTN